ncbi:MAG: hypothetical protein KAX18_05920 [Candidatus Lokiarchaeota archaeon]|nr:hypothetical protein [Candidatus Lokiarchaeota archaeon]
MTFIIDNKIYPLSLGLDHPTVKQVLQIALELTKEHKLINTELLYNRAKRELKIPRQGLNKIIQMLINRKILVDGSRFTKETVLRNKIRNYIFWLIKTNIGSHFSFLKKEVSQQKESEIGVGHLIWHLEKLIKFNLIKKIKIKNCTIFLPIEISDEEGIIYFILRDDLNRQIINILLEHESVKNTDIYKELNVQREKMYYRINKLIEFGIISPKADDEKIISINLSKKDLIIEVINSILYNEQFKEKNKLISMKI